MSGRYGIVASRDNYWTFILIEGMYDIYVRIAEVDRTPKWVHIMCTYDGTILRCYFNRYVGLTDTVILITAILTTIHYSLDVASWP